MIALPTLNFIIFIQFLSNFFKQKTSERKMISLKYKLGEISDL